jgi:hypothetical protein
MLANVVFVSADRRVGGNKEGVVPELVQARHESVVVHAGAAIHARGASRDVCDPHEATIWQGSIRQRLGPGLGQKEAGDRPDNVHKQGHRRGRVGPAHRR